MPVQAGTAGSEQLLRESLPREPPVREWLAAQVRAEALVLELPVMGRWSLRELG
jgi:hypothetical protein